MVLDGVGLEGAQLEFLFLLDLLVVDILFLLLDDVQILYELLGFEGGECLLALVLDNCLAAGLQQLFLLKSSFVQYLVV